jgi:uncharacterized protein YcfL
MKQVIFSALLTSALLVSCGESSDSNQSTVDTATLVKDSSAIVIDSNISNLDTITGKRREKIEEPK